MKEMTTTTPLARRWLRRTLVAGVFAATATWPFWAGRVGLAQDAAQDPNGLTPAQADEMLERYERLAAPGEAHDALKPLVGTFAAVARYAPADDGPGRAADAAAPTSQGTSVNTTIFGGRFLRQEYQGRLREREFAGLSLIGYDNVVGGYQRVMCDEASTALYFLEGSADDERRTLTFTGQAGDPLTGQVKVYRHVLRIESDDRHTLEMFEPDEAGQMRRTVTVAYERIGDAAEPAAE